MTGTLLTKLKRIHQRLNGSTVTYDVTSYSDLLDAIKTRRFQLESVPDNHLGRLSRKLQLNAQKNMQLDDLLIDAYALVYEAISRVLGLTPFDVQIIGAIALHQGKLAEMQTGEGKTLTAVFPSYLNALNGKGVHIMTFNDYLARRDAQWMAPIHRLLNISTGYIQERMPITDRRTAYSADITYLSAKEAGFDFLRDSLCNDWHDRVQRSFNFAVIDEADSILIDEARIPLVIAGKSRTKTCDAVYMSEIAQQLHMDTNLEMDDAGRNIYLTDAGLKHAEYLLSCKNLHAPENSVLLTRLNCAIHAQHLLSRDEDYIVRDGRIELVDEFTGRIADKRRWPDGLQAALEAKERIANKHQGKILNAITLQHYLSRYPKICGMTATAQSAAEEFKHFYNLDIVVVPPNTPCIRVDHSDVIFKTKTKKTAAVVNEIIAIARTKRPILVGTNSVEESEALANLLNEHHLSYKVLNAKQDADEARIIAQAGKMGAVTIATNMAGRGTDIRLGGEDEREKSDVATRGGLYVIGTHRFESMRIDNQLRGRAGRQGDPGESRFFISLEDDLFLRFRLHDFLPEHQSKEGQNGEITGKSVKSEIIRLQERIERQHLDIKKMLLKYSSVIEKQREKINEDRTFFLNGQNAADYFKSAAPRKFHACQTILQSEKLDQLCRGILISAIDRYWSQYLAEIGEVREEIHLYSLGGVVPFFEFQKISRQLFANLSRALEEDVVQTFNTIPITETDIEAMLSKLTSPSATWTYIINDNPMGLTLGVVGDLGLTTARGFATPMLAFLSKLKAMIR